MSRPDAIADLRGRLGMDPGAFARLLGVDERTVRRWESGRCRPTGSAEAVLAGLAESLSGPAAPELAQRLREIAAVGGLAYLIVRLLDGVRPGPVSTAS